MKRSNSLYGNLTTTRWSQAAEAGETWREYPRPQMVRDSWINLNGLWEYAFSRGKKEPEDYEGQIRVPFSPEAPLSGVGRQLKPGETLWYRREIRLPMDSGRRRRILHLGAVDQECVVYVNGIEVGHHVGGYLPLTLDITGALRKGIRVRHWNPSVPGQEGEMDSPTDWTLWTISTLTIRVKDASDTSYHSRGKQKLKRGGMWYTAQSGIWQTVWLEEVPEHYIGALKITPDVDQGRCRIRVIPAEGIRRSGRRKRNSWEKEQEALALAIGLKNYDSAFSIEKESEDTFLLEFDEPHLWTPEDPYLYHFSLEMGEDRVESYFALRCCSIETGEDGYPRFYLNHRPYMQTGLLDQGYWPDGLYTAPSDEALIYDIQTMKDLGYNLLRKHIKIEPDRWYYHCDRLGMLVWQDMVSGGSKYHDWFVTYLATVLNIHHLPVIDRGPLSSLLMSRVRPAGRREFIRELRETVTHLYNHPSIVCWVPFNEGWGQFSAAKTARFLRQLDPTRWIDHASGWFDQGEGDVVSLHYYFFSLHFKAEKKRALALTEFGGYTWMVPDHVWGEEIYGYGSAADQEGLAQRYENRFREIVVPSVQRGVSALIYTQVSDVEEEANGILTYDREVVKLPEEVATKWNQCVRSMVEDTEKNSREEEERGMVPEASWKEEDSESSEGVPLDEPR